MLEKTSKEARGYFLLEFTKELIKNYKSIEIYKLEELIKRKFQQPSIEERKESRKEDIIKILNKKIEAESNEEVLKLLKEPLKRPLQQIYTPIIQKSQSILTIPEPFLPEKLRDLKPTPNFENLNLGKLNLFINDSNVLSIECEGSNKIIFVSGQMGRKPTDISLNPDEIKSIFNEFSSKAKIPITEGITKLAWGNLTLTAITSEQEGGQFILKKISEEPLIMAPRPYL